MLYFSGSNDQRVRPHGVAILVDKETNKSVINFILYTERVMILHHQTPNAITNSKHKNEQIQVYTPTSRHEDVEIDNCYKQIEHT